MKKLFTVGGLVAGIFLIAFFSARSRPTVHRPVTDVADINSSTPSAPETKSHERIPHHSASREPIQPDKVAAQELINTLRATLQSDGDAAWDRIAQYELPRLIQVDPQAAADLAQSLPSGFVREQMLRQVAHGWADQNPTAAMAWAASFSDADDRASSLADVCMQISNTDPADAIAAATQYGLEQKPGLLQSLAQSWGAKDPAAALGWADQLPSGTERDQVMIRLAFAEAQISPRDAAKIVVCEIPAGSAQEEAALSVLHQWALMDLASATAWANQFGDTPFHDRAQKELDGIHQKLAE